MAIAQNLAMLVAIVGKMLYNLMTKSKIMFTHDVSKYLTMTAKYPTAIHTIKRPTKLHHR